MRSATDTAFPDVEATAQGDSAHPEQEAAEQEMDGQMPVDLQPHFLENEVEEGADPDNEEIPPLGINAIIPKAFPIIGIGASAGGLEALEAFFSALPAESGMAFVVVTHTDPDHQSLLPELIARKSKTKVLLIEDGMKVEENRVYLPPSNRDPVLEQGCFRLRPRPSRSELACPWISS